MKGVLEDSSLNSVGIMEHKYVVLMPDKLLLIEMTNGDFRIGG